MAEPLLKRVSRLSVHPRRAFSTAGAAVMDTVTPAKVSLLQATNTGDERLRRAETVTRTVTPLLFILNGFALH